MPRKHNKQPRERLKSPDSDDESRVHSTERTRGNKTLPERRSIQLPPLFPPVSRDIDSENDKKKQQNKQISKAPCRLPPLGNAAMSNMVSHDEMASPDLQHTSALQNHHIVEPKRRKRHKKTENVPDGDFEICAQIDKNVNEYLTSNRHRKNLTIDELKSARERDESRPELAKIPEHMKEKFKIMNPDGALFEGCNTSHYDRCTKRCAKKERSKKQHDRNKSDIKRKQTLLEPLDVPLQTKKLQHTQLGNSNALPSIKYEDAARRKIGQNESGVNEVSHMASCTGKESVRNKYVSHTRAKEIDKDESKSVFELRKRVCEDDKELMKELRLDLSFLYPKKKVKKPSGTKTMDISLRDSASESGENENLDDIDSVDEHEQFDENQSLCITEIDENITEITDSPDLDEDLFEDDDIPIMASGSPTPERCFLLKPR